MKARTFFCLQLGEWFYQQDWHFRTLLATFIDNVAGLPPDADAMVSELLVAFPVKPELQHIVAYLGNSDRLLHWFAGGSAAPRVTRIALRPAQAIEPPNRQLPSLASAEDLADWLGVTPGQLDWLASLKRYDAGTPLSLEHYHYSVRAKQKGGLRLIESPKKLLKQVQRKILVDVLPATPVHSAAHGYRPQRGCRTHASAHTGKEYLFVFDLAHCFHSTQWLAVYRVFIRLGYAPEVTRILTGLCTHRAYIAHPVFRQLDSGQRVRLRRRHLPQGAPTSPALSNAVLFNMDRRLAGLANSLELSYSRYADDIALSGDVRRDWRFLEPLVGSICAEEGFELNFRKSRCLRAAQRQKLTGVVVNKKINIDRRDYDRLKATLTNCVRHGPGNQNRFGHTDYRSHLWGWVQYVKSLNRNRGEKLEAIYRRISFSPIKQD